MGAALSDDLRRAIDEAVLCGLATVDGEGRPNVSPKEIFCHAPGDRLLIAEIPSPVSARNVAGNGQVCVSLVDVFRQKGWKLAGTARLIRPGDDGFADALAPLARLAGPAFPIRAVFAVTIRHAAAIRAPSYRLFPDRSEADQITRAMTRYGVRPAAD